MTDEGHRGKLFVNGISICDLNESNYELGISEKAIYGYNIEKTDFTLDRDRDCVPDKPELHRLTSNMHAFVAEHFKNKIMTE